jgi:uncharacterized membrane protein YedE/YeeE
MVVADPGSWSPYLVGAGIGVLSWLAFLLSNKPLACSTSYARTAGMIEGIFNKGVFDRPYFRKFPPKVDWQWMLVLGMVLGALASSLLFGAFGFSWASGVWAQSFGQSIFLRLAVALAGGLFMGVGARWAGGCTSGHGISGTMQLAASSWLAAACFFAGGIAVAHLLFGLGGG